MSVSDYDLIQSLHVDDGSVVEPEIIIKPQFEDITETSHAYGRITIRRTAERLKSKIEKDQYNDFAILIRRRVRPDKVVIWVKIEIRSPFILRALTVVCGDSFFLNTKVVPMVIERPYLVLFHFRDELREYSKHSDRSIEEKTHLKILIDFMAREFGRLELDYSQHIPKGQVEFSTVWTLFKLNEEVFLNHDNYITCGVVCDVRFLDGRQPAWSIGTRSWAYNGTHFGPVDTHSKIDQFDGIYDITSLPLYPVRYHRSRDKIDLRECLIERGRKWKRMVDVTHCNYESVAWTSPDQKQDCDRDNLVRIHVSGRIILDYNTHRQANMNQQTRFSRAALTQRDRFDADTDSDASSIGSSQSRHESSVIDDTYASRFGVRLNEDSYEMTDNQALLCPARIRGFSLADKKWAFFLVDDVSDIVWRENAMDGLEIDAESKTVIGALVTAHERRQSSTTAQFQDIIPGKGMGLTFLFAGAPGLGKTLTAELISEHKKKALYSITSGELGTDTVEADNRLRMIFNRAKAWDAYLLLDEADVFLAARNQDDLARNGLVTVFLRLIEYYEGVIFLTTNRLTTFDTAFESRIQFKLFYDSLTPEQRAKIWKTLLPPRIVPQSNPVKKLAWDEEVLLKLGRDYDINGREIKNMIKTAHALAEAAGQTLGEEHLSKVKLINDKWHAKANENTKQTVQERTYQCACISSLPGDI